MDLNLTKFQQGNVIHGVSEVFMDKNLAHPYLPPDLKCIEVEKQQSPEFWATQPPVWLPGLPPVVKAKHDGEGAGGQHLVVVVVVIVIQAVSRCQGISVSNLGEERNMTNKISLQAFFTDQKYEM